MKPVEVKELIINSLDVEANPLESSGKLEEAGVSYDFGNSFNDRVLDRIFSLGSAVNSKIEFLKSMNFAFYRIAFTGVAAIIILLISIFMMEGTLSFNSFLGLGDSYNESMVCLLTGN